MFELWYLDLYACVVVFSFGFSAFFAFIGLIMVAFGGRKEWNESFTVVVVGFPVMGILFPLIVLLPFVGIYRLIRGK